MCDIMDLPFWTDPAHHFDEVLVGIFECSDLGPINVSWSCVLQHRQVEFSAGNKQPKPWIRYVQFFYHSNQCMRETVCYVYDYAACTNKLHEDA